MNNLAIKEHAGDVLTGCHDCTTIVADNATHVAAAVRYCTRHKDESARRSAASIAANPELSELHERFPSLQR